MHFKHTTSFWSNCSCVLSLQKHVHIPWFLLSVAAISKCWLLSCPHQLKTCYMCRDRHRRPPYTNFRAGSRSDHHFGLPELLKKSGFISEQATKSFKYHRSPKKPHQRATVRLEKVVPARIGPKKAMRPQPPPDHTLPEAMVSNFNH